MRGAAAERLLHWRHSTRTPPSILAGLRKPPARGLRAQQHPIQRVRLSLASQAHDSGADWRPGDEMAPAHLHLKPNSIQHDDEDCLWPP